ncbi:unnamed protein product [Diabrotica balteata]|uniref:Uncharacterized protein n=1 Tax=Diabrotica balteata TaxID=107213 RepID=A0A9N9STJ6_DIABA|nr:unnamed protein product [Diabrotica balteata]
MDIVYLKQRSASSSLGHILRNNKYQYAQLIVKVKIEGKRGLGRKRLSWLRNIRQ